jgi:hypothetical protein
MPATERPDAEPPPAAEGLRDEPAPARATRKAASLRKSTRPASAREPGELLIPEQPQPAPKKAAPAKRAPRKAPAPRATTAARAPAPEDKPEAGASAQQTLPTEPQTPTDSPSVDAAPQEADAAPGKAGAAPGEKVLAERAPGRTDPWAKIVSDPGHTPELLALAAIQIIGPRAQEWADRIASAYPTATPDGRARLAVRQFTRFGGLSTVCAAVAGSYAPLALLGTTAVTHADLVLHIAAAYGLDPTDERRAADLLVLTKVHPSRAEAESALATARQPAYEDEDGGAVDAAWRLGRMLATQAGGWTMVRTLNRYFPGSSLLAAVLTSRSSSTALAARAQRFYSQENQDFGSTV